MQNEQSRLRMKVLLVDSQEWLKVERIDFYQRSFGVFVSFDNTTQDLIPSSKIKTLKISETDEVIFGEPLHNNNFPDAIINAFVAGGGSPDKAEEYFMENYR